MNECTPVIDITAADPLITRPVSPLREAAAYEALWTEPGASFKTLADLFRGSPQARPTDLVVESRVEEIEAQLKALLDKSDLKGFGVRVHGSNDYPQALRDARHPAEVLYYQGWWELINTPCIAVVGSRNVSEAGVRRTRKLVKQLVEDGYTVVSGLAQGVDTAAHTTALALGGRTVAVIGTPLNHAYPKQNRILQQTIASEHLLVSPVPFIHYGQQDYRQNRHFFPERNIVMSALSRATVIVEASDQSGTLHQARAALAQGRKLFILDSCFQNPALTWPQQFAQNGAIRVTEYADITAHL